ncbi:MAG: single-stranded-DNA-specific exonuclease RecJ [Clostridia bacterium]
MLFKKSFIQKAPTPEMEQLALTYDVDSKIMELLFARGIDTIDKLDRYFYPSLDHMYSPYLMEDMQAVKDKILHHVANKSRILVFGDYDADGICATTIMLRVLKSLGVEANHFLPNRYEDGYGLTMDTAKKVVNDFAPELIITVDCGIGSVEEVEYLKSLGIDIIVTDHHEIGETLPDCLILNPKASKTYPFQQLCGAGVALKLAQAFELDLEPLLAIASIATIADIVELLDENRVIVHEGLKYGRLLPLGVRMMCSANDINLNKLEASKIAFRIAPKLNASGRMGDAETSLQLFLTEDEKTAKDLIKKITNYNTKRQSICNKVYDDVKEYLSTKDIYNLKSIVVANESWNVGILGIVCSRIAEEFNRPTFLFGGNDGKFVGSGRSVNGVNIHEMLSQMSDILDKFGGHTMAAGVTIDMANVDAFRTRCEEYVRQNFEKVELIPTRTYDFEISEEDVNDRLLQSMEKMEPCGHCNAKPLFLMKVAKAMVTPMPNHIEHLMIKYKHFTLLAYKSLDYYFPLKDNTSCMMLVDLGYDTFRGKSRISGTVKALDYSDVYRPEDEDIFYANYLKQLTYKNEAKFKFATYNREQLIRNLLSMRKDVHGTLIVCNDYNSYLNFKAIYDSSNIIQNRIFELLDQSGLNTILLAPKNFNHFNTFSKIIFLDPVLNMGYLSQISKITNATILLPHKNVINSSVFSNINLSRAVFGEYYKLFCALANEKGGVAEYYDLFNKAKAKNPKINYLQFMACLYVFVDLGIILVDETNGITLKVDKDKHTSLESSDVYRQYRQFIAK